MNHVVLRPSQITIDLSFGCCRIVVNYYYCLPVRMRRQIIASTTLQYRNCVAVEILLTCRKYIRNIIDFSHTHVHLLHIVIPCVRFVESIKQTETDTGLLVNVR